MNTKKEIEYKRKFSLSELYQSFVYVPRAALKLISNRRSKLVDEHLLERLNLAVTEVNGCAVCSYAHTKMALQQGMSREEISCFLGGGDEFIKPEEAKAILFAQHFADTTGFPTASSYDSLLKEYGNKQADIIFSGVQFMNAMNMYGIPMSAFQSRLKGRTYKGSTLFYELQILILGILIMPIAIIHGVLRGLIRLSNKRIDNSNE